MPPYQFFYRVKEGEETVWIVTLWHDAQIPNEPREKRWPQRDGQSVTKLKAPKQPELGHFGAFSVSQEVARERLELSTLRL